MLQIRAWIVEIVVDKGLTTSADTKTFIQRPTRNEERVYVFKKTQEGILI